MKKTITKGLTASALIALSVVTVTGCSGGDGKNEPAKRDGHAVLSTAWDNSLKSSEQSISIHTDTDAATLANILKDSMKDDNGSIETPDAKSLNLVKNLATTTLTFQEKTKDGKNITDATDLSNINFGVFVDMNGNKVANIVGTANNLFAKLDLYAIATNTGLIQTDSLDKIKTTSSASWVKDLFDGRWIGLDDNLSKKFTDQFKKSVEQKASKAVNDKEQLSKDDMNKVRDVVKKDLLENSKFTDEGEYIKMETDIKDAGNALNNDLPTINSKVFSPKEQAKADEFIKQFKDDTNFVTYFKVDSNNNITQMKADVMQYFNALNPEKVSEDMKKKINKYSDYKLNLIFDISNKADKIVSPDNYTKVTEQDLQSLGVGGQ